MDDRNHKMGSINYTIRQGRLADTPERVGEKGCKFAIATDIYMGKDKDKETLWTQCIMWNENATNRAVHLPKGTPVTVQGREEPNNYEKDGQTVRQNQLVVVQFQDDVWTDDKPDF